MVTWMVSRFKRVEVQVNRDKDENTYSLLRKITLYTKYNYAFYSSIIITQAILMIIYLAKKKNLKDKKDEEIAYSDAITFWCYFVCMLVILMILAMNLNLVVQFLSLQRLIKFLTCYEHNKAKVLTASIIFGTLSTFIYIVNIVKMLMYYLGTPAV